MGITIEASQGAIFKSFLLQSVNCLVLIPENIVHVLKSFFYCLWSPHEQFLIIQWQAYQDDESNPHPSAVKYKLWSGITLRSPSSVVSDSFGHENEVDISMSSEDKMSATGSKVAPRSMGSLFSPMEKKKRHRKSFIPKPRESHRVAKPFLQFTWE